MNRYWWRNGNNSTNHADLLHPDGVRFAGVSYLADNEVTMKTLILSLMLFVAGCSIFGKSSGSGGWFGDKVAPAPPPSPNLMLLKPVVLGGIFITCAGIVIMGLGGYFPLIPGRVGLVAIVVGIGMSVVPFILVEYETLIVTVLIGGLVCYGAWEAYQRNRTIVGVKAAVSERIKH